jgi:hypothetical protein
VHSQAEEIVTKEILPSYRRAPKYRRLLGSVALRSGPESIPDFYQTDAMFVAKAKIQDPRFLTSLDKRLPWK